jgi:cytochrome c oxidase subunit 2
MHTHRLERLWLGIGVGMLVVFLATLATAAIVDGFVPPSNVQSIDPAKVASTPPFNHPGLHKLADGSYEAYYVAHIFAFEPHTLRVPLGAHVTFYVTSLDVVHGFSVPETGINTMVTPGWVSTVSYTFRRRGTFLLVCNEYCGIAHHDMADSIEVQ